MTESKVTKLRWGIISAGLISGDFCLALRSATLTNHAIVAVAARKLADAQQFAAEHNVTKAYGSYSDIATDPDVDVAYIGVVNSGHVALSIEMLRAGKHVVCEKPMAMSATQCKQVLQVAKECDRLFVEGMWSRFFPAYSQLRKELEQKSIGDITGICVHFGFLLTQRENFENSRVFLKEIGGGAMLDIGCYALQLINLVYSNEKPSSIHAHGFLFPSGVDKKVSATMLYSGDRVAQFYCALDSELSNKAFIYGTKGTVEIPMFWCPTEIKTPRGTFEFPLPEVPAKSHFRHSAGFVYEIRAVEDAILNGKKELVEMKHADSLAIAEIQDVLFEQLGIKY